MPGADSLVRIAHIIAAVFCFVVLSLSAYIASQYGQETAPVVFFLLFNSFWSLLVLAYLSIVPTRLPRLFNNLAGLVLTGITASFWFAGAIGVAGTVGAQVRAERAATAFSFFACAMFIGLLVVDAKAFWHLRRGLRAHSKPGQL